MRTMGRWWILLMVSSAVAVAQDCSNTARRFAADIGPAILTVERPLHDARMQVCYDGSQHPHHETCCTHEMERKYVHHAERDFHRVLQATSAYLKELLTANGDNYTADFLSLINTSANRTETLFLDVYKISHRVSKGPLQALFLDLEGFVRQREVNIHETVAQFFDDLFPLVFHNIMNDPSAALLSEDYHECLTEIRQELYPRPFGDVPNRLAHQLSKALTSSKLFLDALALGIEALNTTQHLTVDEECVHALTRLRYCADCSGHVGTRPCRNFCYNVMRGCLATVGEIDRHWNEYVDSVKALTMNMQGYYNLETTLTTLHSRISEAVLHAMETGHKFYAQIVEKCGHPRKVETPGTVGPLPAVDTAHAYGGHTHLAIHTRLENFMRSLMASKGFYHSLADTMCVAEKFATGMDQEHCWNGHHLGRYNRSLVAVDLEAQMRSNPEMRVATSQSSSIIMLIDKLIHIKKQITSKVSSEMIQADDWSRPHNDRWPNSDDGYGSGGDEYGRGYGRKHGRKNHRGSSHNYYNPVDDEDYTVYSGSGSGDSDDHYKPVVYPKPHGGHKHRPDQDPDIYLEDDNPTQVNVNRNTASNQASSAGNHNSSASHVKLHWSALVFTTIMGFALWLNG